MQTPSSSHILTQLWTQVIQQLAQHTDAKKIISFLSKCAIIDIDEKSKHVVIGIPNEFIWSQVKKFFVKSLTDIIQDTYNAQFRVRLDIYPNFQNSKDPLLLDIAKLLGSKLSKWADTQPQPQTKRLELDDERWYQLDGKYQFENFVVWSHNKLAYSAAQAVADQPGQSYNPLFIYGSVWLGKTHLLEAIGNYLIQHGKYRVVYLPTSKLVDQIIDAIRKNKLTTFQKKFAHIDVLILDDVQFLANKEKTQEIFHHLFNDFESQKKQIVLSSDRPPRELVNIESRLKTRFSLWLVTDISQPDYETRVAILQAKCEHKWELIELELLELIASTIKDNIRELEGIINMLLTKKHLLKIEIDREVVTECLRTMWYKLVTMGSNPIVTSTRNELSFTKCVDFVSHYYNISVVDIRWTSRKKEISLARQMLMTIAKKHFNWTYEAIGMFFGGKNHASVIYAVNTFEKLIKVDSQVAHDYHVTIEHM